MASALIELEQARRAVLACAEVLPSERVSLSCSAPALGRVLAEDVHGDGDVPSFENSAMDGFALRCLDVGDASPEHPVALRIVGESRAGAPTARGVGRGEAIAISTGAAMPDGADAVVPFEQTRSENDVVEVLRAPAIRANVRLAGEDVRAGQLVLARGAKLGPAELGVLAALGRAEALCTRRPRLSVITTGDELVEPGHPLPAGAIYNSNASSLAALAQQCGAELAAGPVGSSEDPEDAEKPTQLGAAVADDADSTRAAIAAELERADVLVLCGGVSVGEHDHVRAALAELGVQEHFWGVALKPGKPTLFAAQGRTLVFGLPGNPVSAMVTFILFVAPAVRALGGSAEPRRQTSATLSADCERAPGRAHAVRCRLRLGAHGWEAEPTGAQGSHVLTSMLDADALAILPAGSGTVTAGTLVTVELLPGVAPAAGAPAAGAGSPEPL
jgi:molybdopterin molybdotransferase